MSEPISILSTRMLNNKLQQQAAAKELQLDEIPFIRTESIQSVEVQQEVELIATEITTVVFTSIHAVEAVAEWMYGERPDWTIYCTGPATLEAVIQNFGDDRLAGSAENAADLATEIIAAGDVEEVVFFCGDQRRDELPQMLRENGIQVQEVIVYETVLSPKKISKQYNGILFFSPSAVESFFSVNTIPATTTVFAIGNTTAAALKQRTKNTVVVSETPEKEAFVQQVLLYYSTD